MIPRVSHFPTSFCHPLYFIHSFLLSPSLSPSPQTFLSTFCVSGTQQQRLSKTDHLLIVMEFTNLMGVDTSLRNHQIQFQTALSATLENTGSCKKSMLVKASSRKWQLSWGRKDEDLLASHFPPCRAPGGQRPGLS